MHWCAIPRGTNTASGIYHSTTNRQKYQKNNWFRFDLSVTLLCTVVFILDLTYKGTGSLLNWILIFRQFRIIRLFELTNDFKKVIEISLVLFPQLLKFLAVRNSETEKERGKGKENTAIFNPDILLIVGLGLGSEGTRF